MAPRSRRRAESSIELHGRRAPSIQAHPGRLEEIILPSTGNSWVSQVAPHNTSRNRGEGTAGFAFPELTGLPAGRYDGDVAVVVAVVSVCGCAISNISRRKFSPEKDVGS